MANMTSTSPWSMARAAPTLTPKGPVAAQAARRGRCDHLSLGTRRLRTATRPVPTRRASRSCRTGYSSREAEHAVLAGGPVEVQAGRHDSHAPMPCPESHTLQRRGVTVLQMRKLWCPAELNSSRPLHHLSAFVYPRRIEPAIWRKITPISIEVADQSKQANLILTGINFVLILEYYRANRPSWQR